MTKYVQVKKRQARNGKESLALSHPVDQLPTFNITSRSVGNVTDDRVDVGLLWHVKKTPKRQNMESRSY